MNQFGEQLEKIQAWLKQQGEPDFRFQQVREAWYREGNWSTVTTVSKDLRERLAAEFPWLSVIPSKIATSPQDGTKKSLLTLHDNAKIESVFMPNARGKRTLCISSQVGCAMACTFCATGTMGLIRNLSVDEIIDQVRFWRFAEPGQEISNIVFMGMGEPLANYEAAKTAAWILINEMGIGETRITVSTVGVPAALNKMLNDDEFPHTRIAFSLHAGTDETRASIVPSHRMWTIKKIVDWMKLYIEKKGNRRHYITIEYVMLENVNDMLSEAHALVKAFTPIKHGVKLNLIPWNPTGTHLHRSRHEQLIHFQTVCEEGGIATTIRYSKGLDIEAACGQLVVKAMEIEKTKALKQGL